MEQDDGVTEVESLCMKCGENGMTRLLLTDIPHFRQIILMAFECEHCGLKNNEVQSVGMIQPFGCCYKLSCQEKGDLNRQLVRSETAQIKFPSLELELPASKKSTLTTVEGLLRHIIEDLSQQQPVRQALEPEVYTKIESILVRMEQWLEGDHFEVELDDPTGNSYLEDLYVPLVDPRLTVVKYERSIEQDTELGLNLQPPPSSEQITTITEEKEEEEEDVPEVMHFPALCSACHVPSETRMHVLSIPYFKEVVIMSTACEACGYKSNEVKASGAISDQGRRIELELTSMEDLSRDILKSETCGLSVPEIDLQLQPGTLGGRFTTVEGLLTQVYEELSDRFSFNAGDSATTEGKNKFSHFLSQLSLLIKGELKGTLILDDPLANSYLQNLYAPDPDPCMRCIDYDRTYEQNEELGLNDMKVENYSENT